MLCPLEQIEISECPVKTCMWYSDTCKGNCSLANNQTHEVDIGRSRGLTVQQTYRKTAEAKTAIINAIVLDNYINFVKQGENREKCKSKTIRKEARTLRRKSILSNKEIFRLSISDFIDLMRPENFLRYTEILSEKKVPELNVLLGVGKIETENFQTLLGNLEK